MNKDANYIFEIEMKVRDYECDFQGIVNNAVYQNYLEHCRHEFLNEFNLSPVRMHEEGIDAVVTRIEIDYRYSLRSGDAFLIQTGVRKNGNVRFIFDQRIIRKEDSKPIIEAVVTGALVRNGRPIPPVLFDVAMKEKGLVF
ncbi:MAG: acyl-CoA thioesterase [Bacteroidota bacterium]|nr:acyl-CoA thioesterase [Bacteroidota bacterium]